MDPEPVAVSSPSSNFEESSSKSSIEVEGIDEDDPISLSGTSIAFFGLAMAIALVGVPLSAIVFDRPRVRERIAPTAFQSDGPESSLPISFTRFNKPRR